MDLESQFQVSQALSKEKTKHEQSSINEMRHKIKPRLDIKTETMPNSTGMQTSGTTYGWAQERTGEDSGNVFYDFKKTRSKPYKITENKIGEYWQVKFCLKYRVIMD